MANAKKALRASAQRARSGRATGRGQANRRADRNARGSMRAVAQVSGRKGEMPKRGSNGHVAEALKAERERFFALLNQLPAYVVLLTADYHVAFANRFFEERFGKDNGRRCFEYLFDRSEPCENCQSYTPMKTRAPHDWEWNGPDGRVYEIHDFPFADADGSLMIMEMGIDITERKRAEVALKEGNEKLELRVLARTRELQESEARFRTMADGLPQMIWVHDAQGRQQFVNRTFCEFFGVGPDKIRPETWQHLVHPEDGPAYEAEFLACIKERRLFYAQARVRRANGEWRWIESFGRPRFSETGEFLGMVGTSPDITERKQAEAVLARDKEELERLVAERTARLQELVAELEHFSYTITHDMRAPLRAMRGLAEIMSGADGELSEEDRAKFIRRIITAAERMDGLITDALNYSRAVRQELPLSPVNVGDLLAGMLDTYPEFQASNADIQVQPELPVVIGNEAGLTQCFSNLLGNAVKFVNPGEKPQVRVSAETREGGVRICVEDKGPGISSSMLPRVFDMFSRGASPQAGTGIGLALVRKVVDRMGGKVGVESQVGKGSRFWVELKAGQRQSAGSAGAHV